MWLMSAKNSLYWIDCFLDYSIVLHSVAALYTLSLESAATEWETAEESVLPSRSQSLDRSVKKML